MALAVCDLVRDYGDAAAEARSCRASCALFDFSFLECVRLEGCRAQSVIESFSGRSLNGLGDGEIVYALRSGPAGRLVADLTLWRTGADSFDVMSGRREDVVDLLTCAGPDIDATDMTPHRAVFAVQGPCSLAALRKLGGIDRIASLKYFAFASAHLAGIPCTVGRLGYTGEAGFEILVGRDAASDLWQALLSHMAPAGFIAADMLRIEAGFVLFANEFQLPVWPREVGLEKFGGGTAPPQPELCLVSFRAQSDVLTLPWWPSRTLQRPSAPGDIVVTSACNSIAAGGVLGLGYVLAGTTPSTVLHDSTGAFRDIRLTAKPFYDTAKRRPRAPWR
jgi:glycine cleavage system T protein (aminomethyltransferase)